MDTMLPLVVALGFLVVSGALWGLLKEIKRFHGPLALLSQPRDLGSDVEWTRRVRELEDIVDLLPSKWEQFKEQARAAEERTRARVRRAVEGIEDGDPDAYARIGALAEQHGLEHGAGGPEGGVPPMPPDVAGPPEEPDGPEDWIQAVNVRKFSA